MADDPDHYMLGRMFVAQYPEEWIQLKMEVNEHPQLLAILAAQDNRDIYVLLAEIWAYCGMVVDGTYENEQILKLMDEATRKLREKRTLHINMTH